MLEINDINISIDVLLENVPNNRKQIRTDNTIIHKFLTMNNDTYKIYTFENPIEWTPIKLYQYVYYLLRTQDEFWIVKYSKFYGLKYYYISCIQNLLIKKIHNFINFNTRSPEYLINMHIYNLKNGINGDYYFLCTTNDNYYKYDNYIIKWNDKIEYVQLLY
jgi:hypothetical protein